MRRLSKATTFTGVEAATATATTTTTTNIYVPWISINVKNSHIDHRWQKSPHASAHCAEPQIPDGKWTQDGTETGLEDGGENIDEDNHGQVEDHEGLLPIVRVQGSQDQDGNEHYDLASLR